MKHIRKFLIPAIALVCLGTLLSSCVGYVGGGGYYGHGYYGRGWHDDGPWFGGPRGYVGVQVGGYRR